MADNVKNNGPSVGQVVLYNNSGTTVPAIIYIANASTWAISAVYFNASGTNVITNISHDPNFGSGSWRFMKFF